MKKNIKKSAPKTASAKPAVLRVVSPTTPEETSLENLPVRPRDNRLPAPGSILTKTYRGKTIEVKVLENGFEYEGKVFKSISRIAMTIVRRPIAVMYSLGLPNDTAPSATGIGAIYKGPLGQSLGATQGDGRQRTNTAGHQIF